MSTTTTKEISIGDVAAREAAGIGQMDGEERMALNVGPSHPTTHGVLRLIMELNGDVIEKCEPVLGYLHRGDEKIAENMTYNQFVPYTDRLDYLSPLANNVAYAISVENLAGLEIPERCQAIRVLVCELARISSHLLGMGVFGMDAGAWTPFMYTFTERENYTLYLKNSLVHDLPPVTLELVGSREIFPKVGWIGLVSFAMNFQKPLTKLKNYLPEIVFSSIERKGLEKSPKMMHWLMG